MQLLSRVVWLAHERGFQVENVDANVMIERPKLRPHVDAMRENLAKILNVEAGCVSVKAKTGEGLDAVGRGDAVAAQAIVLLRQLPREQFSK
jgi:2-C-methyl-D-erythritol 2,4-cyclodiphosphate synthase